MRPALEEAMIRLKPASEEVLETLGGGKTHTLVSAIDLVKQTTSEGR